MKNTKLLLVASVAFANGFIANYFYQPKAPEDAGVEPITNAQELVSNFQGYGKYYTISDATQSFLSDVKSVDSKGNGFVVYYGATEIDSMSSKLIVARIDKNKKVLGSYYATNIPKTVGDNCPRMCDVTGGLELAPE